MADKRARIGYTSVAYVTEIFPKVFYDIVPDGVTLAFLTMQQKSSAEDEMDRIHMDARVAAESFHRAGCDVIILGGAPTNLAHGPGTLEKVLDGMRQEFGVPVSSSATAQNKALKTLGAKKVGVVHPSSNDFNGRHDAQLIAAGFAPEGSIGADADLEDYNRIPEGRALELGMELQHGYPDLDTILFGCPHWATVGAIEPLEQELGINVVCSIQAIVWEGLRLAGIDDRVEGYGRLFREF